MDNLIIANRQQGKTLKLIEHCNQDKYSIIVCPNRNMCMLTFQMAQEINKPIPMPITFEDFVNHRWYGRFIDNLYFDELQMSLQAIAGNTNIKDTVIDITHTDVINLNRRNVSKCQYDYECSVCEKNTCWFKQVESEGK